LALTTRYEHQVAANLAHSLVEFLLIPPQTACKKACSQAQQQVGEDGTKNGSLNDGYLVIAATNQYHEQNDLDRRAKCCLKERAKHVWKLPAKFLSSKAKEICGWDHGNVAKDENPQLFFWSSIPLKTAS